MSEAKSGMIVRYRRTAFRKRAPAFTASFIEDRHVVEVPSHLGVARTERLLADGQRALEESPPPLRTCPGRGPDFQGG